MESKVREERIMPADLEVGDLFRLTGTADDPEEAADDGTYEVVGLDRRTTTIGERTILVGLTTLVRRNGGEPVEMGIGPWVPLIRILP